MNVPKNQKKNERENRTRLRKYEARQAVDTQQKTRRRRDNIFAICAAVVIVGSVITVQAVNNNADSSSSATPTDTPTATPANNQGDVPDISIAQDRTWEGILSINGVELGVELDGQNAPQAVASTVSLTQKGFYDGLTCHRLTNNGFYVLQCGDPSGDGTGGPGYSYGPIENAPADDLYPAGTLAMARQGGDASSIGSQFFIVYEDTKIPSDSAGGYSVIGKITSNLDTLITEVTSKGIQDGQSDGKPAIPVTIDRFSVQ